MTPGARVQAAIECLDAILDGAPAERVLTGWARGARYAGSKDRAAVRDHVFDALRNRRGFAWRGGGQTGRAIMIGAIAESGAALDQIFTGQGHAPAALSPAERAAPAAPKGQRPAHELPDWLIAPLRESLGPDLEANLARLGHRARIDLRVNLAKTSVTAARAQLHAEGIETEPLELASSALAVRAGARQLRNSAAYRDGRVELQSAASQAAMETLALEPGMRVLDYCAGGGGKTLALAGAAPRGVRFFAHDANPQRMRDLPVRAKRAGAEVTLLRADQLSAQAPFDLVLCDVPCSGSGTWQRDPDAKWRFAPEKLSDLNAVQDDILDRAAGLAGPEGLLAYATCSLLEAENGARVAAFQTRCPGWRQVLSRRWTLEDGSDGFFIAHLRRAP